MAYPPSSIATGKTDNTAQSGDHPTHHNDLAVAVNDIVTELGTDPAGASASLTVRLAALGSGTIFDVKAYGAIGDGTIDDTDAVIAAHVAMMAAGGGVVYFPPGTYYGNKSGGTRWIDWIGTQGGVACYRGAGIGKSIIKFGTRRTFINTRGNAGGTYANLLIEDLTIDGNNLASHNSTETGAIINAGGGSAENASYKNFIVRRCETKNIPHAAQGLPFRESIRILNYQYYINRFTEDYSLKHLIVEDCDFGYDNGSTGGNYALRLGAFADNNDPEWAGTGLFRGEYKIGASWDDIYIRRVKHRTQAASPTTFTSDSNFIIGGGNGGKIVIEDFVAENSGDDGIEINSHHDATLIRCHVSETESVADFFWRNQHGMADPENQRTRMIGCTGRTLVTADSYEPYGHIDIRNHNAVGGFPGIRGRLEGDVNLENIWWEQTPSTVRTSSGNMDPLSISFPRQHGGRGLIRMRNLRIYDRPTLDFTAASKSYSSWAMRMGIPQDALVDIEDITFVRDTTTASGSNSFSDHLRLFALEGNTDDNFSGQLIDDFNGAFDLNYFYDAGLETNTAFVSNKLGATANTTSEFRAVAHNHSTKQPGCLGPFTDAYWQTEAVPGATITDYKAGVLLKRQKDDADTYIEVYITDDGATSFLCMDDVLNGVRTSLLGTIVGGGTGTVTAITTPQAYQSDRGIALAARLIAGTSYFVYGKIRNNVVQGDVASTAPANQSISTAGDLGTTSVTIANPAFAASRTICRQGWGGFVWVPMGTDSYLENLTYRSMSVLSGSIRNVKFLAGRVAEAKGFEIFTSSFPNLKSDVIRFPSRHFVMEGWDATQLKPTGTIAQFTYTDAEFGKFFWFKNFRQAGTVPTPLPATLTAPGTGVAYINKDSRAESIYWSAGTLTTPFAEYSNDDGTTWTQIWFADVAGQIRLLPGDQVRWTYSSAPTFRKVFEP